MRFDQKPQAATLLYVWAMTTMNSRAAENTAILHPSGSTARQCLEVFTVGAHRPKYVVRKSHTSTTVPTVRISGPSCWQASVAKEPSVPRPC